MTLEQLMDNPYAWLILAICTILSFAYAIYMGIKSKEKKEISYMVNTYEIVRAGENVIPEFQISYCGHPIGNLTVSRFAIWNSGNKLLNSNDVVDTKPLSISSDIDGPEILDVSIIKLSEESNKFSVDKKSAHCAEIKFDYMDKQDGIVVQILHTGSVEKIFLTGLIKGGKKIKNTGHDRLFISMTKILKAASSKRIDAMILGGGMLALIIVVSIFTMLKFGIIQNEAVRDFFLVKPKLDPFLSALSVVIMDVYAIIATIICYQLLKLSLHLNVPSTLRDSIEYDR